MFFTNFLRTPLTGVSQLSITSAVTKGKEIGTTLVGSAWTRVTSPFITPVGVAESATGPSRASRRILATLPSPTPAVSLATFASIRSDHGVVIGPYRSRAHAALQELARVDEQAEAAQRALLKYERLALRLSKISVKSESSRSWWGSDSDYSLAEAVISDLNQMSS